MKLVFAQGNPGDDYEYTRHNVGFTVLDAFARENRILFQPKEKFRSLMGELTIKGEKILLAKPMTYYNETGLAARSIIDFYKIDASQDVLVVHDELALPFGTLRSRQKGSDAGNNGIKSLNAHLGDTYYRLRIGIASDKRAQMVDVSFVLGTFGSEERDALEQTIIPKATELITSFIDGRLEPSSHTP